MTEILNNNQYTKNDIQIENLFDNDIKPIIPNKSDKKRKVHIYKDTIRPIENHFIRKRKCYTIKEEEDFFKKQKGIKIENEEKLKEELVPLKVLSQKTCPKCKSREVTWIEIQDRRYDESSTREYTCACKHTWKYRM